MPLFSRHACWPVLVWLAALPTAPHAQTTASLMTITVLGDAEGYEASPSPTALRADTPANRVPQSLTVIARSLIDDQAMQSLRDDVQYYRDLYNIEQVEVLKGANGMLFGRSGKPRCRQAPMTNGAQAWTLAMP